jgi:DNA helicase IV
MNDIIATIQAEQDSIIRSDIRGTLVVAGGPGTGKTAVALHRAAYLLYTYRERLENSGVLVVGPNPTWTRYIDHVLPSLGETSVVSTTIATLLPGLITTSDDVPEVATIKGDERMATVIANAVALLPRFNRVPVQIRLLDLTFELRANDVRKAATFARGQFDTYNEQRVPFLKNLLDIAITRVANARKLDAGNAELREELGDELREDINVRREFNLLWMPVDELTALRRLLSEPDLMSEAARGILTSTEQQLLRRPAGATLTTSDVPLLDEFAELLGPVTNESAVHALAQAQQQATLAALLAQAERDGAGFDSGGLDAYHGMVDSSLMLERYSTGHVNGTLSERAAGDREWTYGHIVVDEAQELSAMAWRALVRRVPSKSMTVVGDLAQASTAAAADSWASALDRVTGGNWRLETLTVNYRTPGRLLIPAHELLVERGLGGTEPVSAREGDRDPVRYTVARPDVAETVATILRADADAAGTWAVIATDAEFPSIRGLLATAGFIDPAAPQLDSRISLLTAHESKGLEFDHVVVVDPSAIRGSSAAGDADLYVALTRPTQSLHVIEPTVSGTDGGDQG